MSRWANIAELDVLAVDNHDESFNEGVLFVLNKIDKLPVRETAHWVKVHGYATPGGDPVWCCSECGKGLHVYGIEYGTYGKDVADHQWVACPNCGRLMEGEE